MYVPSKAATMSRTLSSIDVAAIIPRSATGSSASDKTSLPDRLSLMGEAFGAGWVPVWEHRQVHQERCALAGRIRFRQPLIR